MPVLRAVRLDDNHLRGSSVGTYNQLHAVNAQGVCVLPEEFRGEWIELPDSFKIMLD